MTKRSLHKDLRNSSKRRTNRRSLRKRKISNRMRSYRKKKRKPNKKTRRKLMIEIPFRNCSLIQRITLIQKDG